MRFRKLIIVVASLLLCATCMAKSPAAKKAPAKSAATADILKKILVSITAEPDEGYPPLKVQFGVENDDEDSKKPVYLWNFGDGTAGRGPNPVHVFKKPGEYKVTLRVEDVGDRVGNDDLTIYVDEKE